MSDRITISIPPMTTLHVVDGQAPILSMPVGAAQAMMGALVYRLQEHEAKNTYVKVDWHELLPSRKSAPRAEPQEVS